VLDKSTIPRLSKSKLLSAWQCPRKLHLEIHRPELAEIDPATEALFATGHQVGALAKTLYGTPGAVDIPGRRFSIRNDEKFISIRA